jgi:Tol biopolymer transport system component/DNA-binding winged helix-turn-helix (wHTH) protein
MPGYTFGPFFLDTESRVLERNGDPLPLSGKTLDALTLLVQNRGRALTKDELMSCLWPGTAVEEANLTQTIFTLRKLLGDSPRDHRYIATLPGRGYQFVAVVSAPQKVVDAAPATPLASGASRPAWGRLHIRNSRSFWIAALLLIAISGMAAWWVIAARNIRDLESAMHVVPFTNLLGYANSPQFSPDGNAIAFSWAPEDHSTSSIYVKMVGSNTELQLTAPPGWDTVPAWAPDGRQIAFCRDLNGNSKYYTVSALGGPPREVFHSEFSGCKRFAWLADGKHLAVRQESSPLAPGTTPWQQGNHAGRIVSVDLASGAINPLTSPPLNQMGDFGPAVSPDGHTIAFIRQVGTNVADIFWVAASGGEARRLTNCRCEIAGVAWTPDSRQLVFAMARNSEVRLLRIGIGNHKTESILSSTDFISLPTVARRGNRLAYVAQNGRVDLRRMKLRETDPSKAHPDEPLVATTRYHGNPMYSPDGHKLAFHSNRSGSTEIWVSDADGSHLAQLTNCGGTDNGTPRWSPDGSLIAFDSRSTGNAEIFVVSSQGSALRQITNHPAEDVVPTWSHDGKWIYFASNRDGDFQIWETPAGPGEGSARTAHSGNKGGRVRRAGIFRWEVSLLRERAREARPLAQRACGRL